MLLFFFSGMKMVLSTSMSMKTFASRESSIAHCRRPVSSLLCALFFLFGPFSFLFFLFRDLSLSLCVARCMCMTVAGQQTFSRMSRLDACMQLYTGRCSRVELIDNCKTLYLSLGLHIYVNLSSYMIRLHMYEYSSRECHLQNNIKRILPCVARVFSLFSVLLSLFVSLCLQNGFARKQMP